MKNIYNNVKAHILYIISGIVITIAPASAQITVGGNAQNGQVITTINGQNTNGTNTVIYVSKQTGQTSTFAGSYHKKTDQFENGTVSISTTGPIKYNIQPASLAISPNQDKTWAGTVSGDPNSAVPGTTTAATLIGSYNFSYSRPYGSGTNGTVTSTYYCSNNGSASGTGGCAYHNHQPGVHEIVNDVGQQALGFSVISVYADIPDTVCLGRNGQNNITATCYPLTGGTFKWTSTNPAVVIMNSTGQTANIKLLDTNVRNAVVQVTYSIGGVTYTKAGVLSTCECSCRPITNGISAGPIRFNFNVNPNSPMPDGQGNCRYKSTNASFTFNMNGIIQRTVNVPGNATVEFGKNCQSGALTDVKVDWTGDIDIPEIEVNGVKIIKLNVTAIHLTIATNGNLSGSVTVKATNTQDRDLSGNKGVVMLRKGTNTNITFTFNNQNGFNGQWNFSGIHNIEIDLVKKNVGNDVVIANFKGDMTANGVLNGNLKVVANASYKTNLFTITMLELTLGIELKVQTADFALKSGSGKVRVSQMSGVTGTIDLGLNFPGNGNCTATVQASNITAFSMTLSNLNLQADFNEDFDMTKLQGSLQAKHNQFSVNINVSKFKISNGALDTFAASGAVRYSAFDFNLQSSSYSGSSGSLSISAKVDINATGTQASIQVSSFTIAGNGAVSVGGISGSLNRPPASFTFSATFGQSRFQGSFSGNFANIGLGGSVDMGAIDQPQYYNFAYLSITARTNVPLGQSGLKLTQVGGQAGYNYQLVFPGGQGSPAQGNYIVGLTLGVADVADMCEVTGNAVVQFSSFTGNVVLTLNGSINVLKNNTFFNGNMNVNYRIPQNTIDGSVGATVKIPSSGFLISTNNCNVSFNIGNGTWGANGNNMSGQMFNGIVQLRGGHINMNGSLTNPTNMSGSLGGQASAAFNYSMSVSAAGNSVSGNISLSLNSQIDANINQNGLSGNFSVTVTGNGSLTLDTWLYTTTFTGSAVANGQIGYNNGSLSLSGTVDVTLPISIPFWGNQISTGINISI